MTGSMRWRVARGAAAAMAALTVGASTGAAEPGGSGVWAFCHGAPESEKGRIVYSRLFAINPDPDLLKPASPAPGPGIEFVANKEGLADIFLRDLYGQSRRMHFYSCGGGRDRAAVEAYRSRGREAYARQGYDVREVGWTPQASTSAAGGAAPAERPDRASAAASARQAQEQSRAEARRRADAEFERKLAEHKAAVDRYQAQLKAVADEKARQQAELARNVQAAAEARARYEAELARAKAAQDEYERQLKANSSR